MLSKVLGPLNQPVYICVCILYKLYIYLITRTYAYFIVKFVFKCYVADDVFEAISYIEHADLLQDADIGNGFCIYDNFFFSFSFCNLFIVNILCFII